MLVVGAGLTGLTAALELARMGIGVRVIDATAEPATASGPVVLHGRTVDLLASRGLDPAALGGTAVRAAAVRGRGKLIGSFCLAQGDDLRRPFLLADRAGAERALRDLLATCDVSVERPAKLIAFLPEEPGAAEHVVRAIVRHGDGRLEEVPAPYLIGAGGARGNLRSLLGQPSAVRPDARGFVLADVRIDGELPADRVSVFVGRRPGCLVCFPRGGGRFLCAATELEPAASHREPPGIEDLQQMVSAVLPAAARVREVFWSGRVRGRSAGPALLRQGRVFLAGEAAQEYQGLSSQGANYGIQDVMNLGWKLALVLRGEAVPGILDTYRDERLEVIRAAGRRADQAAGLLGAATPLAHHLVTRIAPGMLDARFVVRLCADLIGAGPAGGREGPLPASCPGPGSLQAGDPLPDLPVLAIAADAPTGAMAHGTRLHELADPSRLTVLFASTRPGAHATAFPGVAQGHRLVRAHHIAPASGSPADAARFAELLGSQGLFAVRPDLCVGFAGRGQAAAHLAAWLSRWFPAGTGALPASSLAA